MSCSVLLLRMRKKKKLENDDSLDHVGRHKGLRMPEERSPLRLKASSIEGLGDAKGLQRVCLWDAFGGKSESRECDLL